MKTSQILNKNIYAVFAKYVSLNVLSMIGFSLYVLADTFFVANGIGNDGLISLNLAIPIYGFINGMGLLIGMGGATQFSISNGERNSDKANRIFTQVFVIGLSVGLILTLCGVFLSDDLSRLLGATNVFELTRIYVQTVLCFACAFITNNILLAFVRNDGNPNLAMIAMLAGSLTNIVFDYIFVFPMNMGMFGAALATGASPLVSICILCTHFMRKKNHFKLQKCKPNPKEIQKVVFSGMPSFINEFSTGIIILIFNFMIMGITGDMGVAAYGIITNIALVCIATYTGLGQGIQPIISVNYGAGRMKNVRKVLRCACIVALVMGVIYYLMGTIFAQQIISVFNKENNPELTHLAIEGINLYFIAFILMGLNIVIISFFASMSHSKPSFVISILRGFAMVIPLIILLPPALGITGVWLTVPIAETVTLIVSCIFVKQFFKKIRNKVENA